MKVSKPWAFDDCPQWRKFREYVEETYSLRLAAGWTVDDDRTRGDNWSEFHVYEKPGGDLLGSILVHGRGPEGFQIYYGGRRYCFDATLAEMAAHFERED